jgi:phosphoribosylglycinamide formyltransferase 1
MTIRLGILGSTRGTHLQTIIAAIATNEVMAEIALVISNKVDAGILACARTAELPAVWVESHGKTREQFDQQVSQLLLAAGVDLIVLIGYMRILSAPFVRAWQPRIINVHPSLLPKFAGKMDLDVHRAVLAAQETESGCTVHVVTDEVDGGPILVQKTCQIAPQETAETLKAKVQLLEGEALIAAINQYANTTK